MHSRYGCFAIVSVLLACLLPAIAGAQPPVYVLQWGSIGSGNGQFDAPIGIATDASGDVFVLDRNNQRVQKFTGSGTYITQWGSLGTGNGQFRYPAGLAIAPSGNIYVCELFNARVQVFGPSSTPARTSTWGQVKRLYR